MRETDEKIKLTFFTEDCKVIEILESLNQKEWKSSIKKISGVTDDSGNQYVDLVMEGGGVLGMALIGYTYILERMNIRFLGVGGTSAGAINALLLASLGGYSKEKSIKLLNLIKDKDFFHFVDGDILSKTLIRLIQKLMTMYSTNPFFTIVIAILLLTIWLILVPYGAGKVLIKKGLNPGNSFLQWIQDILNKEGIKSLLDLYKKRRQENVKLYLRNDNPKRRIHVL